MLPEFMHLPVSTGYILAGLFTCHPGAAPDVTLQFRNEPPVINHTRSSAYLLRMKKNSSSPPYGGAFPILDGITNGKMQMKYDIEFTGTEETRSHQACVAASAAHLVITYKPVIYISSNILNGTCRYDATLDHEMKHVRTDIKTINEYIPDIREAAERALRHAQTARPVASRDVDQLREDISDELSKAVDEQSHALEKTRTTRQRGIDSAAEYTRLSHACPDERWR